MEQSNWIELSASRKHFWEYFLLAAITLIAAALRFYKLGEWSFWGDEVFTIGFQEDGFSKSLTTSLIHGITGWLGVTEWTARLVPALIGVLSTPIFYFLIKRVFSFPVALFAALLLAVSPWHLYWSQNARFYTLLLLFYSLGLFLFLIGLE
jgi:predicted membrane-bound mannosyltransferase